MLAGDRVRKRIAKGFALSFKLILDFWENHANGPCQSKDGIFIFPWRERDIF